MLPSPHLATSKPESYPDSISESVARNFMLALLATETSGDAGQLIDLFTDDCALMSVGNRSIFEGHDGAEQFWRNYLGQFDQVRTRFTNVFQDDTHAALEWASEATTRSGHTILYEGATILTFEGGKIKDFRTYFDTAVFLARHHGEDQSGWVM